MVIPMSKEEYNAKIEELGDPKDIEKFKTRVREDRTIYREC